MQLPNNLTLTDAKVITTRHGIAFQGPAAYLSNLSPAEFEYENQKYTCVEQGLVYIQANVCKNPGVAALVLNTDEPFTITSLAYLLPKSHKWDNMKDNVDYELNFAKFTQNQHLAKKLANTHVSPLYEATKDTHF